MELECTFTTKNGQYTCRVSKASIARPNIDIVGFKGKHQMGKNNNDVTEVNFDGTKVEYFPRHLQRIFPSLTFLIIRNCGLKEISRHDFVGLGNLTFLSVAYNELRSLPDDLFSNMPNLKYVSLSCNKVEFASSKLIEPIVDNPLKWFIMRHNTNIDEFFDSTEKTGCKTIEELMAKIDEKCTPPTPPAPLTSSTPSTSSASPPIIPTAARRDRESNSDTGESAIRKFFSELRLLDRFSDFVITVGSKEFPVHKSFLAQQSAILAKKFEVKKDGRYASKLEISDLSAEAVGAFLDYLYERERPDTQYAFDVFMLAAKYEVASLKAICEEIIEADLDESNAFAILKLACGPNKSEVLKVAAFRRLKEKFGDDLNDDLINNLVDLQILCCLWT